MSLPKRVTTLLVKNANPIFSLAHKLVPNTLQNHAVLFAVNQLAKEFIEQGDLDFMEGKIAKVEISDIGISWFFTKTDAALKMLHVSEQTSNVEADVVFSGTLDAIVLMASQTVDPDTLFFNRQLKILGDTELGLEIKNLIDQFDIDQLHSPVNKILNTWADNILQTGALAG